MTTTTTPTTTSSGIPGATWTCCRWAMALPVWGVQYCIALPAYAVWRVLPRLGWIMLAICTLGLSVLIRHFLKRADKNRAAIVQAIDPTAKPYERHNWSKVTRPWLAAWVKG